MRSEEWSERGRGPRKEERGKAGEREATGEMERVNHPVGPQLTRHAPYSPPRPSNIGQATPYPTPGVQRTVSGLPSA